ncbi:MAG: aspartate carbamoyltransferase catalytic subunit [Chloroflexota bacterium]
MTVERNIPVQLSGRSFAGIDDFSNAELAYVLACAADAAAHRERYADLCRGRIMASLFFEPSTRTRLSFETAMLRLGGQVISSVDIGSTSLAKGETLADMAKVVGGYADIMVMRHPWEGAARVVADHAGIPVINAGDGGHEHPTQTLCDLFTLKTDRGRLEGLRIALWGDLKYGRTVHSLAWALARFGSTVVFRPGPGLEAPAHVLSKLETDYGGEIVRGTDLSANEADGVLPVDAVYVTPRSPHQLAMLPHMSAQVELDRGLDAIYVTRLQRERMETGSAGESSRDYPIVNKKLLRSKGFERSVVLHPLPRVDELALEMDSDPRSLYFKQAHQGVPVRMALISLLLGCSSETCDSGSFVSSDFVPAQHREYRHSTGVKCPNPRCVVNQETESKYLAPRFKLIEVSPPRLRCSFCDHEVTGACVATSEAFDEPMSRRKYHPASSRWATTIRPENLLVFATAEDARTHGFKPAVDAGQGGGQQDG